ncbi:DinB family protein [Kribbella sp. NPDC050124]|uniref:DinB family protein n=1 Tax=Kribbella sp. NPDC050124 TaxID=3364114 RepID=UPI00378E353F
MIDVDAKQTLHTYLRSARGALVWKLEGLSEYDVRRPLTPTGTNLLGLVKHLAIVEAGYFGETFDRPYPEHLPWWDDDAEPNADAWATEDETRADIVDCYRRVWDHADATIDALDLDAPGRVPWWPEGDVTLHRILVHVLAETNRHAGHADIVREQLDGATGLNPAYSNMPDHDAAWWQSLHTRIEQAAKTAQARSTTT